MDLGQLFQTIAEKILVGFKFVLAWLVDLGGPLVAWLPNHKPLALPAPDSLFQVMAVFGTFGRFVDWPIVLGCFGAIVGYKLTILLYGAYRAVLGFVPMLK